MEYYGNDYRSYLSHYGVLGMHWGIRRYQPYGAGYQRKGGETGKELAEVKKVASYKEKEIRKAEKAYAKDLKRSDEIWASNQKWLDRKKRAYENTTDERKRAKLQKKIKRGEDWAKVGEMRKAGIQAMRSAEISAINKMTMADIKAEKKKIGKEVVKAIAFDLSTIPLAALTGVYIYRTPNVRNIKTRNRLGLDDKKNKKDKNAAVTVTKNNGTVDQFDKKSNQIVSNVTKNASRSNFNSSQRTMDSAQINKAVTKAKKTGSYEMAFLEATQNDDYSDSKMASEYRKYLKDRNKYMQTH